MPDSGVCAISPSDLVGYVGNLINRVKELEQRMAQIESGNVEANQLSDLSQQVGWVGGVNYMGTDGWTQTEYGTLIPPAGVSFSTLGFTLSDGNTYNLVVMDENGVLQYGFTNTGTTAGAVANMVKTALFQANVGAIALGPGGNNFTWATIEHQSFATNYSGYINVTPGLYLLTASSSAVARTGTAAASTVDGRVGSNVVGNAQVKFGAFFASGETTGSKRYFTGAVVARFPDELSNSSLYGFIQKTGTPTINMATIMFGVTRLGD